MDVFDYSQLHSKDALDRYVSHGIEPGGFLQAMLRNDLMGACRRADHLNIERIPIWANYIYNELPSMCHGSKKLYDDWVQQGGMLGAAT